MKYILSFLILLFMTASHLVAANGIGIYVESDTLKTEFLEKEAVEKTRKGFILGVGLGGAFINSERRLDRIPLTNNAGAGLLSDFKIGAALTDQWMLYWSAKVLWFRTDLPTLERTLVSFTQAGVGATYFFYPEATSAFISAGLGFSNFSSVINDALGGQFGIGVFIGGGFEVGKHWLLSGDLIWGSPGNTDSFNQRESFPALSFGVSFGYLLY